MGKPRKEHPDEESIFANNPFIEGFFEWMDSPEGEKHLEIYDVLSKLLEDVHLDARERKVIWPDAERLDIEQSVQRIQKLYRNFPRDEIEEFMIDWIDMGYEPENYSPQQFNELDRLTERWVADHLAAERTRRFRMTTRADSRSEDRTGNLFHRFGIPKLWRTRRHDSISCSRSAVASGKAARALC